jgi:hypothetical protein
MRISKKYKSYIPAKIAALILAASMIVFPGVVLNSAKSGITLWLNSVLPALLPFFICTDFMIALEIPQLVGSFFDRSFKFLFRVPGSSAFVFITSITSGYPMGAKIIGKMKKRREITDDEGIRMLSFCSTSGPLFILGTVGLEMFKSHKAGIIIALSHYLSAIINGLLFRFLGKDKDLRPKKIRRNKMDHGPSGNVLEILTNSILTSLKTLGIICCYLIIFIYITDLIEVSGFFKGLIEMTIGVKELSLAQGLNMRLKCTLASFLISFGGISVMAQSMSVLEDLRISYMTYILLKLSHAFIAALTAYIIAPFFLAREIKSVALINAFQDEIQLGFVLQLLFSTKLLIIIMSIFALTIMLDYAFALKRKRYD